MSVNGTYLLSLFVATRQFGWHSSDSNLIQNLLLLLSNFLLESKIKSYSKTSLQINFRIFNFPTFDVNSTSQFPITVPFFVRKITTPCISNPNRFLDCSQQFHSFESFRIVICSSQPNCIF